MALTTLGDLCQEQGFQGDSKETRSIDQGGSRCAPTDQIVRVIRRLHLAWHCIVV
jgi:hypothetical protein